MSMHAYSTLYTIQYKTDDSPDTTSTLLLQKVYDHSIAFIIVNDNDHNYKYYTPYNFCYIVLIALKN